ncbi:protein-export membrane protein SecD [Candidatus Nomurabacteria bacterium RIFCSPLOWO2_02_FULL_40_10]|uniref:Protein translocase subunit SecD n=1 Tax=Candidatus Nomurabacteria bacterium RIFCSPLOWO2_02_FULL_40_10 TaxID=1801786 RepID=A0A1F6XZ73_9BACT|nr:MAG: protein-export membrane protein SecD [Candidatus Nomurabacteria bacterium RIFCSPLOWO2_02_FULL_40_10]
MKSFKSNLFILIIVLIAAIAAGIFVTPKWYGAKHLPWNLGLDLVGGTSLTYKVDLSEVKSSEYEAVVGGLKEVIEKRVNLYGVAEPKITIAQKGDSYELIVDLAGVKDLKDAVRQIGETPRLDFREVVPEGEGAIAVKSELTGRYIAGASLAFDNLNKPVVNLKFNDEGAKIFEELTARNVGKPLAIFVDDELTDAPTVKQKISGGEATISGGGEGFTIEEAKKLVQRLNAGALSAPISLSNQRTVSATAAEDALNRIIVAGVIGTALVALFMVGYYRLLGVFAVLALLIYTAFTLAIFKSGLFGLIPSFTMTLSGIAGFILSVGMAVDANILIFERTKEEARKGVTKKAAVEEGFKRAWLSIRDSNISTIITATILYYFTSSFVQGFALTLGIGVLISMFSAIFVTRTMLKVFTKN